MVGIIIKEIMMEPWKNPISMAVSVLDMRLRELGWVSRELADISSYFHGMCLSCCHGLSATWRWPSLIPWHRLILLSPLSKLSDI